MLCSNQCSGLSTERIPACGNLLLASALLHWASLAALFRMLRQGGFHSPHHAPSVALVPRTGANQGRDIIRSITSSRQLEGYMKGIPNTFEECPTCAICNVPPYNDINEANDAVCACHSIDEIDLRLFLAAHALRNGRGGLTSPPCG